MGVSSRRQVRERDPGERGHHYGADDPVCHEARCQLPVSSLVVQHLCNKAVPATRLVPCSAQLCDNAAFFYKTVNQRTEL